MGFIRSAARIAACSLLALSALCVRPALGAVLSYQFTANVGSVDGGNLPVALGDPVTGVVSWDTAAADGAPAKPLYGFYSGGSTFSISSGAFSEFHGPGASARSAYVCNACGEFGFIGEEFRIESLSQPSNGYRNRMLLLLRDANDPRDVLSTDALPTSLDLADFGVAYFLWERIPEAYFSGGLPTYPFNGFGGTITSLSPVPEPAALVLLGAGLAALELATQRRRPGA